jgi:hypothetical protein
MKAQQDGTCMHENTITNINSDIEGGFHLNIIEQVTTTSKAIIGDDNKTKRLTSASGVNRLTSASFIIFISYLLVTL